MKDPAIYQVKPVLRKRRCGGWLATTPRGWPLGIGVTADTEEEAVREFEATLKRWSEIEDLCPDCKGSGKCGCGQCPNGVCAICGGTGRW